MMKSTRIFIILFGAALALCVTAFSLRDRLLAPVLQRVVGQVVGAKLGLEVSMASISGTYFSDLKITGLRTLKPAETGILVSVGATTIHAYYSLPLLLQGREAFLGNLRLELDGAQVALDFTRGSTTGGAQSSSFVLPATRARDSRVDLRGRDWRVSLIGTDLTVAADDPRRGGIPLAVHATTSIIELPGMRRQTPGLAARGVLTRDSVTVANLDVDGKPTFGPTRFAYGPDRPFTFDGSFAAFAGRGKVHGLYGGDSSELEWDVRNVDLAKVAALFDREEAFPTGRLASSGSVTGNPAEPESLAGSVALKLTNGGLRKIPFKQLTLKGTAAAGVLQIETFAAEVGKNVGAVSGVLTPIAPLAAGKMREAVAASSGHFKMSLEDIPSLLSMAGVGLAKDYLPDGVPPHRLLLAGQVSPAVVTIETGSFSGGGAEVTVERGEVTLPVSGLLFTDLGLSLKLRTNIPDLGQIGAIFGWAGGGGRLKGEVDLAGVWPELKGSVNLAGNDIRYREAGIDSLLLAAHSTPRGWHLETFKAVRGEDWLTGGGDIAIQPPTFEDLAFDLSLRDFHPYLAWFLAGEPPAARGRLVGHLGLAGSATAPTGDFRAVLSEADLAGMAVSRGELLGTVTGGRVEVASLLVQTDAGQVELGSSFLTQAWGLPVTGTVARFTVGRGDLLLKLLKPVAFRVTGKRAWFFDQATLQGEEGSFRLGGGVSPQSGYDISLGLSGVGSEPLRSIFAELPVEFRGLNLEGTVIGPLAGPEVAIAGSVAELRSSKASAPLAGQIDVRLSPGGIAVKKFFWTTAAGEQVSLKGDVPYNPFTRSFISGKFDLAGDFSIPDLDVVTVFLPANLRIPGAIAGTLSIAGTGDHPEAAISFTATSLRPPGAFSGRPLAPLTVEAAAVFKDNDLRINKFSANSNDLKVSVAGNWHDAGSMFRPRGAAGIPGTLDLNGSFAVADVSWLARGLGGIRRLGGELEGTAALSGPAASPDLTAELSLAAGEFRAEGALPPLRDLQVRLSIARRTATIGRFTGTVGGSPFAVSGRVDLPAGGGPEADLLVSGTNILLYRNEGVKVRADADIAVRGPLSAPAFSGTVAITEGRLQKNLNWLEPFRDLGRKMAGGGGVGKKGWTGLSFHNPPLRDATFDIHLLSKNQFQIRSNVARGALRPDLRLRGTGEVPLLTGVIYVDPSRVMLPAGRLRVESGLIRFLENRPGRPELEISATSRLFGYDINVLLSGPYDEPVVTLSSVPPLPQDALLLLLLTGKLPPGIAEQASGWQGGMAVALYVSKGVLEEWFGGNDLDSAESKLDRFDIVLGRGISRQGNETIGAQYRLADGVVRKGDELFLVAERDIYDEFNTGIRIVFKFE